MTPRAVGRRVTKERVGPPWRRRGKRRGVDPGNETRVNPGKKGNRGGYVVETLGRTENGARGPVRILTLENKARGYPSPGLPLVTTPVPRLPCACHWGLPRQEERRDSTPLVASPSPPGPSPCLPSGLGPGRPTWSVDPDTILGTVTEDLHLLSQTTHHWSWLLF